MTLVPATLAALARDAYTTRPSFFAGDVAAVMTELDDVTVIAYRGTRIFSVGDWQRDLSICPAWHWGLGWVHGGFLSGARAIAWMIHKAVQGRRVAYIGHSLGGALACCGAGLAVRAGIDVAGLMTFGAPRVALTTRLSKLLHAKVPMIQQYRDADDAVPEVPWPYRHVARLIGFGVPVGPIAAHAAERYVTGLSVS